MGIRLFRRRPRCRYVRCKRRATCCAHWRAHETTSALVCQAHALLLADQGNWYHVVPREPGPCPSLEWDRRVAEAYTRWRRP